VKTKRTFSPEYKAKVVLEILREEKTVPQLASEMGVHPTQINRWRKKALESLPHAFKDDQKEINKMKQDYEGRIEDLYSEIGKLTTQLSWLKKKSGFSID
jgi:transposase